MKSLVLQSSHYQYLEKAYREYLQILGYAAPTVKRWPEHIREFLHYLENYSPSPSGKAGMGPVPHITAITIHHVDDFTTHIKRRSNQTKKGSALSASHINTIINAVTVFAKFLNSTGKYFLDITADREAVNSLERIILTVAEIKQLYEATFLPHRENTLAMGQRDRAIIAVFYGCGLRRSEGADLNISDIDLQSKLLFVRKGKGNKQRYIPIANKHLEDIRSYLQEGREWFLQDHYCNYHHIKYGKPYQNKERADEKAFFVSQYGKRFTDMHGRLKYLQKKAEITKNVTLHGLRHSIATHLLQSGMDIEEIAKFLGHASLASTQIYTHIINEHGSF